METRKDRVMTVAVVTGLITLLLGLCLGAFAGGLGGYLIGRRTAPVTANRVQSAAPRDNVATPPVYFRGQAGAKVVEVVVGSPADSAGIKQGDVLMTLDGQLIDANHALSDLLASYRPGDKVQFTLSRDSEPQLVTVELGARLDDKNVAYLGIRYQSVAAGATPSP